MANPIKGENNILYIYDTAPTAAYKPVACLTSNSISNTVSVIESQTKCYPGQTKKQAGTINYSIDFEGEFIDTTTAGGDTTKKSFDSLLALQNARTLVTWKIDTDVTNAQSTKYYGTAIISDLSLDAGAGDELSTFSGTFDGDGIISTTNPIV